MRQAELCMDNSNSFSVKQVFSPFNKFLYAVFEMYCYYLLYLYRYSSMAEELTG
jgi:hypothetical protein